MKFVPRSSQLIGRMVIRKSESKIIRVDATKVTKFILVDAVGAKAAEAGIKAGDIVLVVSLRNIVQDAGMIFIPFADEKDVVLFVTDVAREDLLVQTPNGKEFVPFDSLEAATSFGAAQRSNGASADLVAGAPV